MSEKAVAPAPQVVSLIATPHGGVMCLDSNGQMFERVPDPAPASRPGPPDKIWVRIKGPHD